MAVDGGRVCPKLMLWVCVMLRLVIALAASLAREPTAVNTEPGPTTSTSSQLMGIPSPFPHAGCASSSSGIADLIRAEPSSAPGSCSGAVSIELSGTLHGTKCGHACGPPRSLPFLLASPLASGAEGVLWVRSVRQHDVTAYHTRLVKDSNALRLQAPCCLCLQFAFPYDSRVRQYSAW